MNRASRGAQPTQVGKTGQAGRAAQAGRGIAGRGGTQAQLAAARAEMLELKRKRRRRAIGLVGVLSLSFFITVGVFAGRAAGWVVAQVQGGAHIPLLSTGAAPLVANKVAPPNPMDVSGPAQACAASSLTVTVLVDDPSIAPGQGTAIHITVRNSGWYPCIVNGGLENLRLRLVDANGKIGWNSEHCETPGSRNLLMGPGNTFNWDLGWDGHASAPGVCTGGQPAVNNGTWHFIASLAEVAHSESEPTTVLIHGDPVAPPAPEAEWQPEPEPAPEAAPEPAPEQVTETYPEPEAVEPPAEG